MVVATGGRDRDAHGVANPVIDGSVGQSLECGVKRPYRLPRDTVANEVVQGTVSHHPSFDHVPDLRSKSCTGGGRGMRRMGRGVAPTPRVMRSVRRAPTYRGVRRGVDGSPRSRVHDRSCDWRRECRRGCRRGRAPTTPITPTGPTGCVQGVVIELDPFGASRSPLGSGLRPYRISLFMQPSHFVDKIGGGMDGKAGDKSVIRRHLGWLENVK